ncbi:MAG: YqgE/AlgH family protein [Alphaproteobacteria bacterium]|nr:YqgE/AlgH family protein [Alphaproteobacteria bacterium]
MDKGFVKTYTGIVDGYLSGYLLVAMPMVQESRFQQASIFICGHDQKGAIGLILNKPLPGVHLHELLGQLNIPVTKDTPKSPLFFGGPVDMSRGFVLHSTDYQSKNTVRVNENFGVTATIEILRSISRGTGPLEYFICLGYSGWSEGQLETEMQNNNWLITPSTPELVFHTPADLKWKKCMFTMGLNDMNLPYAGGHA